MGVSTGVYVTGRLNRTNSTSDLRDCRTGHERWARLLLWGVWFTCKPKDRRGRPGNLHQTAGFASTEASGAKPSEQLLTSPVLDVPAHMCYLRLMPPTPYTSSPWVPGAALLRTCRAPAGFVMHRRCSPVRKIGTPRYDAQQNAAECNRFQRSSHRYPNPATVAGGLGSGLRRNDDVSC